MCSAVASDLHRFCSAVVVSTPPQARSESSSSSSFPLFQILSEYCSSSSSTKARRRGRLCISKSDRNAKGSGRQRPKEVVKRHEINLMRLRQQWQQTKQYKGKYLFTKARLVSSRPVPPLDDDDVIQSKLRATLIHSLNLIFYFISFELFFSLSLCFAELS